MNEWSYLPPIYSQAYTSDSNQGNGMSPMVVSAPYPTIEGRKDPETVALIKKDYAGAAGELTAITGYLYQNIRLVDNEALAKAMLQIAIAEMTHLDMLGDAIQTLGGVPTFHDGRYYWHAGDTKYPKTMIEMIKSDIDAEKTAIRNYKKHAAMTRNESVRALLLRIAEDEKLHLGFLEETLDSFKQKKE